jgi:hypothetical protein
VLYADVKVDRRGPVDSSAHGDVRNYPLAAARASSRQTGQAAGSAGTAFAWATDE